MENKSIVKKLATRKDIRERMSEQDARELLIEVRSKVNTLEEIESELRKIYDSPIEVLILHNNHNNTNIVFVYYN